MIFDKIFIFANIVILFVLFKSYYDTIKSKNYRNCKRLFFIQLLMLTCVILNMFMDSDLNGNLNGGWITLYFIMFYIIPSLAFIILSSLILRFIMKRKKYNLDNNINSKKYILVIFIVIVISIICYAMEYINIEKNAISYYENKYNVETKIVARETLMANNNSIGDDRKEGLLFILNNGDKVFYDVTSKEYYDNKQSKTIISLIDKYYEDNLTNLISEFKNENILSAYLLSPGDKEFEPINMYSHIANANTFYEYKYYDEEEFYFNNYYNIRDNNAEEIVKSVLNSKELLLSYDIVHILCDKNGKWEEIMKKYTSLFELTDITFELYDINSVPESVVQTHKLNFRYRTEPFAIYYNLDGKYSLKK